MTVDVVVDSREKLKPYFIATFLKGGINARIEALPAGDFMIYGDTPENSYLIERKEASDVLGSLEGHKTKDGVYHPGRIWNQIERMQETGVGKLRLLIEGNPLKASSQRYRKIPITPARVYGAYEGILKFDIKIVWTEDKEQTTEYIKTVIKRMSRKKTKFALRTSAPNSMTLEEKKNFILQGFPKIGANTSKLLVEKYPTLMDLFNDIDNIDKLPGIGVKTKEQIKEILTG